MCYTHQCFNRQLVVYIGPSLWHHVHLVEPNCNSVWLIKKRICNKYLISVNVRVSRPKTLQLFYFYNLNVKFPKL